jgi:calcineurin-like phosphoesterase
MQAVLLEVEENTGRALSVKRIEYRQDKSSE